MKTADIISLLLTIIYIENKDNVLGGFLYDFFSDLQYYSFKNSKIKEGILKGLKIDFNNIEEENRANFLSELFLKVNESPEIEFAMRNYIIISLSNLEKKLLYVYNYILSLISKIFESQELAIILPILKEKYEKYKIRLTEVIEDVSFESIEEDSELINFTKFNFLYKYNISSLGNQIVLAARYGIGKTIASLNLIDDIISSNDSNKYVILYFGTSEVNKTKFYKRTFVTKSSYDVNFHFKKLQELKKRVKVLKELELDNLTSGNTKKNKEQIKKLYDKLEVKKLKGYIYELLGLLNRYNEYKIKKDNIKDNQNKYYIKNINSWLLSLEISIKELINKIETYLSNKYNLLSFILNIIDEDKLKNYKINDIEETSGLKLNFDKYLQAFSKTQTVNDIRDMDDLMKEIENDFEEEKAEETEDGYSLNKLKEIIKGKKGIKNLPIQEISNFVLYLYYILQLIENDKEIFINDFSVITNNILNTIEDLKKQIFETRQLLEEDYNKIKIYLEENNLYVYNDLNIDFIEEKLEEAKLKNPNKGIIYIIDYHNSVKPNKQMSEPELSVFVGEKALEYCGKYNAFGIIFSQLNDVGKNNKNYPISYRPMQADIRGGEGIAHKVGAIGIIYNRDMIGLNNIEVGENIDTNFVIYEIYLTKNRYGQGGPSTKQYFILDRKKMKYVPINEGVYDILEEDKEIIYLDQLRKILKDKYSSINVDNMIFN